MRNRIFLLLIFILFLFEGRLVVFAGEDTGDSRDVAVDRAIGGMEEGSRPLSFEGDTEKNQTQKASGSVLSPSLDTRVTASAKTSTSVTIGATPKPVLQHPTAITPPVAETTTPVTEPIVKEPVVQKPVVSEPVVTTPAPVEETTTPIAEPVIKEPVVTTPPDVPTEPISSEPIVQEPVVTTPPPPVEETTTPIIKPIIPEPVQQEPVVTTPPIQITPTEPSPSEPVAQEPATSENANDAIVNLDASADLSGGEPAVDANLSVDTNAQGGLLDANAATTTDAGTTEVTAVESGQIAGQDLTSTVESALVDIVLDTEIVATDTPPDSEATAGLEASVDETGVVSDVPVADPADGLGI